MFLIRFEIGSNSNSFGFLIDKETFISIFSLLRGKNLDARQEGERYRENWWKIRRGENYRDSDRNISQLVSPNFSPIKVSLFQERRLLFSLLENCTPGSSILETRELHLPRSCLRPTRAERRPCYPKSRRDRDRTASGKTLKRKRG